MNSMHSKIDYAGRTVDLLLLKTVFDVPVVNKRVDIDIENDPMIVSGVEKMVQRYFNLFITALGSVKFRPDHGTRLVPKVETGWVYNMSTLETTAAEANLMAQNQMKDADDGLDTPDDEKLASSTIIRLEFSRERATVLISVRLTTEAGKSYVYVIPVGIGVH